MFSLLSTFHSLHIFCPDRTFWRIDMSERNYLFYEKTAAEFRYERLRLSLSIDEHVPAWICSYKSDKGI